MSAMSSIPIQGMPQVHSTGLNGSTAGMQPGRNPQSAMAMHAMQQHAQNAQTMLQSGQLSGPPPMMLHGPAVQQQQQQQRQQMSAPASYISKAAQPAQFATTASNATAGSRPVPSDMNMADFPFDWRLLPQIAHLNDLKWRVEAQQRNPQLLAAVQSAAGMIASGSIHQEVLQRMQQIVYYAARPQNMALLAAQQAWQVPAPAAGGGTGIKPSGRQQPTTAQMWSALQELASSQQQSGGNGAASSATPTSLDDT